ncbi:M24 family metallopeptidase [Streptomyces paromomycinus]|uniref:M24 family metallopeptidase n=1 Tax=Streptomyces paromomycinus TaxID=92743 RepID=UPI001FE8CCAF|nr:M24 family metallopeptidase [Streptomyces paromomycinus]
MHGLPGPYRLHDGDLVSIGCDASVDSWAGDATVSFAAGTPSPANPVDPKLMETTRQALEAGVTAAVVGARVGDSAHTVGRDRTDAPISRR